MPLEKLLEGNLNLLNTSLLNTLGIEKNPVFGVQESIELTKDSLQEVNESDVWPIGGLFIEPPVLLWVFLYRYTK